MGGSRWEAREEGGCVRSDGGVEFAEETLHGGPTGVGLGWLVGVVGEESLQVVQVAGGHVELSGSLRLVDGLVDGESGGGRLRAAAVGDVAEMRAFQHRRRVLQIRQQRLCSQEASLTVLPTPAFLPLPRLSCQHITETYLPLPLSTTPSPSREASFRSFGPALNPEL